MEFWGKEVKPGTKVSCEAGDGYVIHLSQAALGDSKKGSENVTVSVKVDDQKLVLGTLSVEKHPQIMCDLVFDKEFELSHSSKTTSVFFCGYKTIQPDMFGSDSGEDEDEELETDKIPMKNSEIEKSAAKVPVKAGQDKQDEDEETSSGADDFSDDSDDDSEMSEDESSGEDDVSSGADDFSDETDDSEEEQMPTPKKPEGVGKKRAIETMTPSNKMAKTEPSGDKKGVHVSTPHPAKQASKTLADKSSNKTPAADKKSKEKSSKSGGHSCKSCNKTFGSEVALGSHQKAKHRA